MYERGFATAATSGPACRKPPPFENGSATCGLFVHLPGIRLRPPVPAARSEFPAPLPFAYAAAIRHSGVCPLAGSKVLKVWSRYQLLWFSPSGQPPETSQLGKGSPEMSLVLIYDIESDRL